MTIDYVGSGGGIPRKTAHIFAKNADASDLTVFGSTLDGNTQYTDDIANIQNAAFEVGWRDAVISNKNYPLLADMNGVMLTFSQQLAYLLQHGLAQWDSATTYYTYDIVNMAGVIYVSLIDNNTNNNPTSTNKWAVFYDPNNALNKNTITDCIIGNLNNITVSKVGGLVTLRANSKVYLPNGTTTEITIPSDIQLPSSQTFAANRTYLLYGVSYDNGTTVTSLRRNLVSNSGSGSDATGFTGEYYNIDSNSADYQTIKLYTNGTPAKPSGQNYDILLTFPIAFITADENGNVNSISQIQEFDTFGFIGSVAVLYPGVTYLVPNGTNLDGTLKNYNVTNNALKLADVSASPSNAANRYVMLRYSAGTTSIGIISQSNLNTTSSAYFYDEEHNFYVQRSDNTQLTWAYGCSIETETTAPYAIKRLKANPPFRAVNYYDIRSKWVNSSLQQVSSDTEISAGGYLQYSLSSYLPQDGNVYEVMVSLIARMPIGTSGQKQTLDIILHSDVITTGNYRITCSQLDTQPSDSNGYLFGGCAIIPCKSYIQIRNGSQIGNTDAAVQLHFLDLIGYRKVV